MKFKYFFLPFLLSIFVTNLFAIRIPFPKVGAANTPAYFDLLRGKKIALVVNQTSTIGNTHLVDTLLKSDIKIEKIFAPEHGFRGTADAGAQLKDGVDAVTKIKVISLYGKKEKPSSEDLKGIEIMVFDVQDVGCRFYTFLSTLHLVMEACAENNIPLIILDRPNPNGNRVDGPVLDMKLKSFVGIAPIPVLHGLTIGEYAKMAVGEKWFSHAEKLDLKIIPCGFYTHSWVYQLPIKPSPNLPNPKAIFLYPSLCFFEGTNVSVGRGTEYPFQVFGSPHFELENAFKFIPKSKPGATDPFLKEQVCRGFDLRKSNPELDINNNALNLHYLVKAYQLFKDKPNFFLNKNFFDKLMGNETVRTLLVAGKSAEEISKTWEKEIIAYKIIRKKYLLYKDFE